MPVHEGYTQTFYSGVAFDIYVGGALWQRVRPDAGVTYVGTATGGTWRPMFEPMPADSPPLQYFAMPPANSTLARREMPRGRPSP